MNEKFSFIVYYWNVLGNEMLIVLIRRRQIVIIEAAAVPFIFNSNRDNIRYSNIKVVNLYLKGCLYAWSFPIAATSRLQQTNESRNKFSNCKLKDAACSIVRYRIENPFFIEIFPNDGCNSAMGAIDTDNNNVYEGNLAYFLKWNALHRWQSLTVGQIMKNSEQHCLIQFYDSHVAAMK